MFRLAFVASVELAPIQTSCGVAVAGVTFTDGALVSTVVAIFWQPVAVIVPVTVYVVVDAGLAVTVAPVEVFRPVDGDQE